MANNIQPNDLDLLTIKMKLTNVKEHTKIRQAIESIFYQSMHVIQGGDVILNATLLADYDKNQIQLYDAHPFKFGHQPDEDAVKIME